MADASAVANTKLQGVQRYQTHPHGSDIFVLRFKREDGSPMNDFFKFPSTPHLAVLLGVDVRGDKVMSEKERDEFLRHEITVEEKIDGANLGISFDGGGSLLLQNRGGIVQLHTIKEATPHVRRDHRRYRGFTIRVQ